MANVITVQRIDFTGSSVRVRGNIALSGSYVQKANGGEILDFTKAVFSMGPVGNAANMIPASKGVTSFDMWGCNGNDYGTPSVLPIAALQVPIGIFAAGSASELAAGAYGAGITGDNIQFEAVFDSGI